MKKVLSKSNNSPKLVRPNRHKKSVSLPQEPDAIKKIQRATESHAERARVNGFIQLGYLPHIFLHERYPDTLLDRLWGYFECDRVPEARCSKTKYEMWFWIFHRWAGMPDDLWKVCSPITHLPLHDPETRELKKERYGGRSDLDIVMLEDLKKDIENISKNLNIDFPFPSLLCREEKTEVIKPLKEGQITTDEVEQRRPDTNEKPLHGYKEIGEFLGVRADTVKKTYKAQGVPTYTDKKSNRVYAFPSELNKWKKGRSMKNRKSSK